MGGREWGHEMQQHKKTQKTQGLVWLRKETENCTMKNRTVENEIGPNVSVIYYTEKDGARPNWMLRNKCQPLKEEDS